MLSNEKTLCIETSVTLSTKMSYGIVLAITHENDPDFRPNFLVFLDQLWRQKPQVHSYYPLPQTPPYVVMIMDICSVLWDTNYK